MALAALPSQALYTVVEPVSLACPRAIVLTRFYSRTGLNTPIGLAFDSAGNLYAANQNSNAIEKFTPGGVGSVFANSGLSNPQYLAFTTDAGVPLTLPIPEPGSLGLLALAAAGLLRRWRIWNA